MKRLKEIMPYGYSCVVQKVECRNHLLRNYCQKIMALTKKTEYSIQIRNYIANNAMRFRTAITKSIAHHKDADGTMFNKINGLLIVHLQKSFLCFYYIFTNFVDIWKDIKNSFYHILGEHRNCEPYFCIGKKNGEVNLIFEAEKCDLIQEVTQISNRIAGHSDSLYMNVDNNTCEQFNSMINKHIAGERINFSQRNSYNVRVEAALVSYIHMVSTWEKCIKTL